MTKAKIKGTAPLCQQSLLEFIQLHEI